MKYLLLLIIGLLFVSQTFGQSVNGVATNAESGAPLSGFDILLTHTNGGVASSTTSGNDGSFTFTDISDGTYNLEFYTYPDPVVLEGDYFLRTIHPDPIIVDGGNVSAIEFQIPPHHPQFTLTGTLIDAITNEPITIQGFEVRAGMQYVVEFFYDYSPENESYIIENLPDWTYEFNVFDNDYYEGVATEITIDPMGPDTIVMDFYLQPKTGATVTGVLLDSTTNQPIKQAGRSISINAINSLFTNTNSEGEFTFVNVPPGTYSGIEVRSQDTSYVKCTGSEISGFIVPEGGVSDVVLYQKPWVSIHEVTANELTFEPGETKTVRLSIVNDDLVYGAIWGLNLNIPDGVTVLDRTPFYSANNSEVIFEELPDCSSNSRKAWQGWHWIGIPPFASSEGNLDVLNEEAWSDVTLQFDDSASMEMVPIFYEIFYNIHCNSIQPFSYGTIMMQNDNITGEIESVDLNNRMFSFPNPASTKATLRVTLDKSRTGKILIHNTTGQMVINTGQKIFNMGDNNIEINTHSLKNGIYYYTFLADDLKLTGKLVMSR